MTTGARASDRVLSLGRSFALLGGRPRSSILLGVALFGSGYLLEAAGIVTKRIEEGGFELPHLIRAGLEESIELARLDPGCRGTDGGNARGG